MSRAEQVVEGLIQGAQDLIARNWAGHERTLLIELVRSLDHIAFAFRMAPNCVELSTRDVARNYMLRGAAIALRPLLTAVAGQAGGVPWGPANARMIEVADQYLLHCGYLAHLRRLVEMERYGLAKTTFVGNELLVIEVSRDTGEWSDKAMETWLQSVKQQGDDVDDLIARKKQSRKRIDRQIGIDGGWFIRYGGDERSLAYHKALATVRARGVPEAEALPAETLLGGRSFREWNEASISAQGRVLRHVACATRLAAVNRHLDLRNLLTVFVRRDDLASVWEEAGEDPEWIGRLISYMTLDAQSAMSLEREHEVPLPYYVDLGRDFVLLPAFGALLNPCAGLVWQLKKEFRMDWDSGVDGREAVFRNELERAFPSSRFTIPPKGFQLRRTDGSPLTDVDAVIVDRQTGSLALVQLKWHDIFGRSLRERNSRRLNLLKANQWVDRVATWVDGRSAGAVAEALNVEAASMDRPPELLVVTRHASRFTGTDSFDRRAAWLGWAELAHKAALSGEADLLSAVFRDHRGGGATESRPDRTPAAFQFRGLRIEVRTG
ncbi:MAG: hypothetical protein ABI671_08515 [Burkholderiales bacterium]